MARHNFLEKDKRILAERVGFHCSNPSCGVSTIGPSINPNEREYVGVAAHIYSASVDNGPRANPNLTEEERSDISNAIHLCNKCSTLIDKNNGLGYSAEVLFAWKDYAEETAKSRVYADKPLVLYKNVNFQFLEKEYSTALSCSGLSEKNVESCPLNEILTSEIEKKLHLANKCIIRGCSGSGKSLLTYQVAYNYYKQGFSVFKISKDLFTNNGSLVPPQTKSVLVVDDAQILDSRYLETILNSAHKDCLVLANWNSSTSIDDDFLRNYPLIDISSSSQVKLLEKFCMDNKDKIAETLKLIGLKIDKKDHHGRIEARIFRASREHTPWLFNYSLTEGWNTAKHDLDVLNSEQKLSIVMVTVAVFQFATLDNGVSKRGILERLKSFNRDAAWLSKSEEVLDKYCMLVEGKIKNKHYEYSRRLLKIYISKKKSPEELNYLIQLLAFILKSEHYLAGHSNLLEFIMFDFRWGQRELIRIGVVSEITSDLLENKQSIKESPDNVTKLNSLIRFDKGILSLLEENRSIIYSWLLGVCRKTAYPLGSLINTLCNEKIEFLHISEEHVEVVFDAMTNAHIEDRPRYAYLLNRMQFFVDDKCKRYQLELFGKSNFEINVSAFSSDTACYQFSKLINDLAYIDRDWVDEQVRNNIEGISELLNNDLMDAYDSLRDLISHYFGVTSAILGIDISDSRLKKRARSLANKLEVKSILKAFENLEAVGVQSFCDILIFLALYDKQKLKSISEQFNYARLYELYYGDKKLDHYHRGLIAILQNRDSKNYREYVEKIINHYNYVDELFVVLAPEYSLQKIKSGTRYKMDFGGRSECKNELIILSEVKKELGMSTVSTILRENIEEISEAIFNKAINIDRSKSKLALLKFIYNSEPEIFHQIIQGKDKLDALIDKVERLIKGTKQEKVFARFYSFLIKKYSKDYSFQIILLEKKFPSIAKFDLSNI